ncbi:MAG TPA: putrescine:ornithine antiporter [Firmicutes bacterium]|jgi:amino acid transporter|nr:putrescine:ornithine antiporter [Bacillota bacterium]
MTELKKTITLWKGIALAVSIVIGSGLLGLPGMTLEIGSVHSVAGGWLLITLAVIPLIYIFSRLGLRFTSAAGLSKYAEAAVGPWGGYAVSMVLCGTFTVGIPAIAWIGGAYVQKLFGLPEHSICLVAIGILLLATAINLLGVRVVNLINTSSLIALVVMMMIIIFANFSFFDKGLQVFGQTLFSGSGVNFYDLWRIATLLFWAFMGWENLSFSLEEFKRPEKNIPRVYWFSFLAVIILYFGLTITSLGAEVSGVSVKGTAGLAALVGNSPFGMIQLLVMVLVIPANANAWIFGASRLYFSSGRSGILPGYLGRLAKDNLPLNAMISSLGVYILVTMITYFLKIPVVRLVLLVTQNWLVLYVFSIFAYWKTEMRGRRWVIAGLASISCGFLLAGFNWWIIYPLGLLTIGYIRYQYIKEQLA